MLLISRFDGGTVWHFVGSERQTTWLSADRFDHERKVTLFQFCEIVALSTEAPMSWIVSPCKGRRHCLGSTTDACNRRSTVDDPFRLTAASLQVNLWVLFHLKGDRVKTAYLVSSLDSVTRAWLLIIQGVTHHVQYYIRMYGVDIV